jgi:hypothetical protein
MPDSDNVVIVIGAQKSGTTSLYSMLSLHPAIAMSREKETDFFCAAELGRDPRSRYFKQFDRKATWYGEASPLYTMYHEFPGVAGRIVEVFPSARLIYIVRDPVERAVSQYKHEYLTGQTRLSGQALAGSEDFARFIETSRYHRQLSEYYEHFDPKQILILDFAGLKSDPQAMMDKICAFLSLDSIPVEQSHRKNTGEELARRPKLLIRYWDSPVLNLLRRVLPKSLLRGIKDLMRFLPKREAPEMDDSARKALRDALARDIASFRRQSGQTFPSWKL